MYPMSAKATVEKRYASFVSAHGSGRVGIRMGTQSDHRGVCYSEEMEVLSEWLTLHDRS